MTPTQYWQETEKGLYRKFLFKDFTEAFGFMSKVAILAEKYDHHPTWTNTNNKVEIWLITHDMGNTISLKDIDFAKQINEMFTS